MISNGINKFFKSTTITDNVLHNSGANTPDVQNYKKTKLKMDREIESYLFLIMGMILGGLSVTLGVLLITDVCDKNVNSIDASNLQTYIESGTIDVQPGVYSVMAANGEQLKITVEEVQ